MYKVEKTNRRTVTYQFETLKELDAYAEKNRYKQGTVTFFVNGIILIKVHNLYHLASYCTDMLVNGKSSYFETITNVS